MEVGGVQCLEIVHLALRVPPTDVARGTDVQRTFIILYIGPVVQRQGIDGVHMAFYISCQHRVVERMMIVGIGDVLPRPESLLTDGVGDLELGIGDIRPAHILRLVGIDTACRIVHDRLRHVAMMVAERGRGVPLLLAKPAATAEILRSDVGAGVAFQPRRTQFHHQRIAIVAIVDHVVDVRRGLRVADVKVKLMVLCRLPAIRQPRRDKQRRVGGKRVDGASLVIEGVAGERNLQAELPVGARFLVGLQLVARINTDFRRVRQRAQLAVIAVVHVGNGSQRIQLRGQQQSVGVVEIVMGSGS